MPPPQLPLPSDHATPRPRPRHPPPPPSRDRESSVPVHAAKRPPPPSPAAKKMARPASAPDLTALPTSAARPRPRAPSTPAKTGTGTGTDGPAAFMAPRGAQAVRPARRLTPGTAVYVRTTFRPRNAGIRCRILLWLRARVVASPDAYHCTVKYAADLSDVFAGKIVSKPADHVRVAPRPAAAARPMEAKREASALPRR